MDPVRSRYKSKSPSRARRKGCLLIEGGGVSKTISHLRHQNSRGLLSVIRQVFRIRPAVSKYIRGKKQRHRNAIVGWPAAEPGSCPPANARLQTVPTQRGTARAQPCRHNNNIERFRSVMGPIDKAWSQQSRAPPLCRRCSGQSPQQLPLELRLRAFPMLRNSPTTSLQMRRSEGSPLP